jgi:hypothetical protein
MSGRSSISHFEMQQAAEFVTQDALQKEVADLKKNDLRRSAEHRKQQRERFAKFQLKASNNFQPNPDHEKLYERQVHRAIVEKRQKEVAAFLEERAKARQEFQLEKARKALLQPSDSTHSSRSASKALLRPSDSTRSRSSASKTLLQPSDSARSSSSVSQALLPPSDWAHSSGSASIASTPRIIWEHLPQR